MHHQRIIFTMFATAALFTSGCDEPDGAYEFDDDAEFDAQGERYALVLDVGTEHEAEATGTNEPIDDVQSIPTELRLSTSELSELLMGGSHYITSGYAPGGGAGGHAGIDFGGTGDGVTTVKSPVNGTIIANTAACGKVAIYDGSNTIILAHLSDRTTLPVGAQVKLGTTLGKASDTVGGGCIATAAHLHIEIRTGHNTYLAKPTNNNVATTLNPLTYTYSAFPPVSLNKPSPGATVAQNPVKFAWSPIQGANTHRLQVSTSSSFGAETCTYGCVYDTADSSTSRAVSVPSGTYYWRVRAGNSGQGGHWSAVRSFTKN